MSFTADDRQRAAKLLADRYRAIDAAADINRQALAAIRALPPHERRLAAARRAILRRAEQGPATRGELRCAVSDKPYRADGIAPRAVFAEALADVADQLAEVDDGRPAIRYTRATIVP